MALLARPVNEITRDDVLGVIDSIIGKDENGELTGVLIARKVRQKVRTILESAQGRGHVDQNVAGEMIVFN